MLGNPDRPKSPIEKRNFMFEILFSSFDHDDDKEDDDKEKDDADDDEEDDDDDDEEEDGKDGLLGAPSVVLRNTDRDQQLRGTWEASFEQG